MMLKPILQPRPVLNRLETLQSRYCSSLSLAKPKHQLVGVPIESTPRRVQRPRMDNVTSKSFEGLGLQPEIQLSVMNAGLVVPTPCQMQTIPLLMKGENLLVISQTGKGKTLAYLLPLVDKLLRTNTERVFPKPNRPRAVVVVPTRELVVQTMGVVRKMFSSSVSSIGLAPHMLSFVKEKRILSTIGADLIVTTPSRLELHMKQGPANGGLSLSAVESFVFDEADTLCDSVYESGVRSLISHLRSRGNACQFVIVGATRTAAVNAFVSSLPDLKLTPVVTEDAHKLVPHLEQVFIPVGRRKRTNCLMEVITADTAVSSVKTLVFTNSVKTCNFVSKFLRETGSVSATCLHGEMPPKVRSINYKKFSRADSGCDVLVCTNLASRGLDLDKVSHVIMYDFPHTLADYIHRAGRTGRAGRLGKVTALYTKKNVALARQIELASKQGKPIEYAKGNEEAKPPRSAVKLEKYKAALSQLKNAPKGSRTRRLGAVRASLGLPPNLAIGSPEKRAIAKEWKAERKKYKELDFLKKRKRIHKKAESVPELPNMTHAASETRTRSRIVRNSEHLELKTVSR